MFKAGLSPFVVNVGPVFPDEHQHEVARCQYLLQYSAEVATQSDAVSVHEHGIFTQPLYEVAEQSSSLASSVLPSVTDEDCTHVPSPPCSANELVSIPRSD